MGGTTFWIKDGVLVSQPKKPDGSPFPTSYLFDALNMVCIELQDAGTKLQWNMGSANWASLLYAASFLAGCEAPYRLKYFNSGWFEEVLPNHTSACARLEQLLYKSDIHFSQRVYVKDDMPSALNVPAELHKVMETGEMPDNISILCKVDFDAGTSNVESIGQQSLLGRVWGHVPVSYPALSGHNYDRIVSQPYFEVLKTGERRYDQVLASMIMPDGERQWFNYHRVILPESGKTAQGNRVRIACAQAPVEIRLL